MGHAFDKLVVKAHEGKPASELAEAEPDVLAGVSAADAAKLREAFGITTIRQFAESRFVQAAQAVVAAADDPGYDPGPPPAWAALFADAPQQTYLDRPDLFRVDFGPVFYRGRLDGTARLLVVGQDPSVNEILAQRVFVGQSGQKLQGFLAKLGITRSYIMLNTFSFSIFNQFGGGNETLSHTDPILSYRNRQLDAVEQWNPLDAVISVGTGAREALDRWPGGAGLARVHLIHPAFPNTAQLLANWNAALSELRPIVAPDDGAGAGPDYGTDFAPGDVVPVPRRDLPFGLPDWHGDGDHGRRDGNTIIEWHREPVI